MAGKMNGLAPMLFRQSTVARASAAMLRMPRLPTVMPTRAPGRTAQLGWSLRNSRSTAPRTSGSRSRENVWRMAYIWG